MKKTVFSIILAATLLLTSCGTLTGKKEVETSQNQVVSLSKAKTGSLVSFGSYEQDNDTSNGNEDIEWIVLAREGDRILVISRYALDCQPYNKIQYPEGTTWETCSLRKWLNDTFLDMAFSDEERSKIPKVTVSADKNPSFDTNPGNATTDQVFLLSISEANKYFSSDSTRTCKGTAYCYAKGVYEHSNGNCSWWLRTPGYYSGRVTCVANDGHIYDGGGAVGGGSYVDGDRNLVFYEGDAVRPALWINLGS